MDPFNHLFFPRSFRHFYSCRTGTHPAPAGSFAHRYRPLSLHCQDLSTRCSRLDSCFCHRPFTYAFRPRPQNPPFRLNRRRYLLRRPIHPLQYPLILADIKSNYLKLSDIYFHAGRSGEFVLGFVNSFLGTF